MNGDPLSALAPFPSLKSPILEAQKTKKMAESKTNLIARILVSLISTSITQLSLFTIPLLFPQSSLLILLPLSVVVLLGLTGVGRCCKRLLRVRASAPAFVFFNILFNWGIYVGFVSKVIAPGLDFLLNIEFVMLVIGLCRMLSTDPGYTTSGSSPVPMIVTKPASEVEAWDLMAYEFTTEERVRYCTLCKAYVREFDHHCPAFGNCIGQKNHFLFVVLLIGFISTEVSYVACSLHYSAKLQSLDKSVRVSSTSYNLAISTMIFSLLQVPWQGIFLAWHIYCICFNIKTDEWINWKKYPEFHLIVYSEPGKINPENNIMYRNPYDKGIMQNVREFLIKPNR